MGSGGVGRLRVDGDARDLREAFLDAVFQRGGDIVDAGNGEIAFHHAVAGNQNVVLDLADPDIVAIDELVVSAGHAVEERFHGHFQLAHLAGAGVGRGDVAAQRLDVNVDVDIVLAEFTDAVLEFCGAAVGFAKAEVFVDFEVEFDEEAAVLLRGGDVVHSQAEAESDSADGFEQVLVTRRAGLCVDDDVRWNDLRDALFNFVGEGVDLLEVRGAGDADGGVNEIAVAGAAEAHTFDAENPVDISDLGNELILQPSGSGIEKRVQRAPAELRSDPKDNASDGETSERVSESKPGKIPDITGPDARHTQDNDDGAPNIRREMQCVGFESFAGAPLDHGIHRGGPGHINRERDEENQDRGNARLDMDRVEKEPVEGFVDDVDSGQDEEPGFDERREIFKFAVAVWVAFVSRLVGDADREKRNDGGDEVEAGMDGFREDAEAVGADVQERVQVKTW